MKTLHSSLALISSLLLATVFSCTTEDPGPIQEIEKEYAIVDFDRLEMGDGLNIDVEQGQSFSIKIEGDRRNINDLEVFRMGNTLIIKYDDDANRNYQTKVKIEMPFLEAVNFSGGTVSKVGGFESDGRLDIYVSGGSVSQLEAGYRDLNIVLSGGSTLLMEGLGDEFTAEISGASVLTAFEYPVRQADIIISGASNGKVTVTDDLIAHVSGSSAILYRGSPTVNATVSGASTIQKD